MKQSSYLMATKPTLSINAYMVVKLIKKQQVNERKIPDTTLQ